MAADTPTATPVAVTSNLSQPPATTMSSRNTTEFLVRFPPFPEVPKNVKIIPFKEFKEKGIRVLPRSEDDDTEVDACDVPTVALGSIHSTDWCKTETKRAKFGGQGGPGKKKRKRKAGGGLAAGPTQADWEEYWEEREASYRVRTTYDPFLTAYERLCQGAHDFKNLRQWPLAQKQHGPLYVWGEFLRFAGIPFTSESGPGAKAEDPKPKQQAGDNSDSDIDTDDDDDQMGGIINPHNLPSIDSTMKGQARGEALLTDPALMLKVFLSSYARDRGIIWTDANLTGAPILMRFFVNFLIENRVLPDREENAMKHESTRRVIEVALKELPLTSKLAKVCPDEFHKACKACWGSRAEVFVFKGLSPVQDAAEEDREEETNMNTDGVDNGTASTEPVWGDPTGAAAELASDADQTTSWGASNGWAASSDGWGSRIVTVDMNEEGELEVKPEAPESAFSTDNDPEVDNGGWATFNPSTFIPLLGPTALPITHTPGIVESSVRRIKSVIRPSSDTAKFPISKDISADAVEGVLKRTFGIVVFEPWLNWNKGEEPHLSMPKILETSRGAVKMENVASGADTPAPTALPPFDLHKDDISVLVDPEYIDLFSVGMGCLCTWVQLAREEDFQPQDPKKKKKKNAKTERLWYVEEMLRVVPSYYTYLG